MQLLYPGSSSFSRYRDDEVRNRSVLSYLLQFVWNSICPKTLNFVSAAFSPGEELALRRMIRFKTVTRHGAGRKPGICGLAARMAARYVNTYLRCLSGLSQPERAQMQKFSVMAVGVHLEA